ncbi:hypothetical protein QJQ45_025834 [Haematococcus lacustris]|nr:hypothetical protein QJQ45_025834 [Haematococcus lacustris]
MCLQAAAVAVTTDGGQGSPDPQTYTRMRLKTKADCRLGVSIYPEFAYNAVGGGGWARVEAQGGSLLHVTFDPQGTVDLATGQMELQFDANFVFSAGPLYTAPPLVVRTLLTTEDTQGTFRKATGQRIVGSLVKLVGTATVDKTGDLFLDNFLLLPTDALAIMSAELEFA